MGTAMPFSLLREVSVMCSSRAATTASSKKSSYKSPRRTNRKALGCSFFTAAYCRIKGVEGSATAEVSFKFLVLSFKCKVLSGDAGMLACFDHGTAQRPDYPVLGHHRRRRRRRPGGECRLPVLLRAAAVSVDFVAAGRDVVSRGCRPPQPHVPH